MTESKRNYETLQTMNLLRSTQLFWVFPPPPLQLISGSNFWGWMQPVLLLRIPLTGIKHISVLAHCHSQFPCTHTRDTDKHKRSCSSCLCHSSAARVYKDTHTYGWYTCMYTYFTDWQSHSRHTHRIIHMGDFVPSTCMGLVGSFPSQSISWT